jgi:hypothetical protein
MGFTSMALRTSPIRLAFLVFGLMAGSAALGASALAQQTNCAGDIGRLYEKTKAEWARVANVVRAAKGKPDPAVLCGPVAGFNNAESALIAYMEKNKDCDVSNDLLSDFKAKHETELAFSRKLCGD